MINIAHRIMARLDVRIAALFVTVSGCGGEAAVSPTGAAATANSEPTVGSDVVDSKGRHWLVTKRVSTSERANQGLPLDDTIYPRETLASMSVDEIAQALRPVSYANGYEFTLAEPDLDMAARVKAGFEHPVYDNELASTPPTGARDVEPEELRGTAVLDADERTIVRSNTQYPFRTHISFAPVAHPHTTFDAGSCSATLIGPSTAISAAHCFHNGSSWISDSFWMVGMDRQDSPAYPYTPNQVFPTFNSGYVKNCYRVTIPTQFVNGNRTLEFDFAVIEFDDWEITGCSDAPGWQVGWLGFWRADRDTVEDYTKYIYGYPTGDDFTCAGGSCFWPSIWGVGASYGSVQSNGYVIENETDAANGQSGSGMYIIYNGNRYVIGIHKGSESDIWGKYNVARRITNSVWDFVDTFSNGTHEAPRGEPRVGASG